jgi:hypothetical protein
MENLRERLAYEAHAAGNLIDNLEHDRASGLFGVISTVTHASVIAQYKNTAEQLLRVAPGDNAALTALKHVEELTGRTSKAGPGS